MQMIVKLVVGITYLYKMNWACFRQIENSFDNMGGNTGITCLKHYLLLFILREKIGGHSHINCSKPPPLLQYANAFNYDKIFRLVYHREVPYMTQSGIWKSG